MTIIAVSAGGEAAVAYSTLDSAIKVVSDEFRLVCLGSKPSLTYRLIASVVEGRRAMRTFALDRPLVVLRNHVDRTSLTHGASFGCLVFARASETEYPE